MNIAVVVRQVPDLIEPLEIDASGTALDLDAASFILNESDDHALEQALLLKEAGGGSVTVVALDFGDVDNTLYAAAAKGADRIVKIPLPTTYIPLRRRRPLLYAEAIKPLGADLVLVGVQAHDELDGVLAPLLAAALGLPYVGVIRGVKAGAEAGTVVACKEFPGAVMARMNGQAAGRAGNPGRGSAAALRPGQPHPRGDEVHAVRGTGRRGRRVCRRGLSVRKLYPPASGTRAEMLAGSETEIAARIVGILAEKGLVK